MAANVDVVLRAYAAQRAALVRLKAGDPRPVEIPIDLYDPGVVLDEIADFPDAQAYRGYDGLVRWFVSWTELYDDIMFEIGDPIGVGDKVVVPTHQRFRSKAGVKTEQDITHVWTLREGRIVHVTGFRDPDEARAAAGADA